MKTLKNDWKLGAAVGTALSLGSAGSIAGPHGFDLHNVLNGASASFAGTSIAHTEDPVSAVFGNPATLAQYFGGTHFMFGATFYQPRVHMVHDGSAGQATSGNTALDTLVTRNSSHTTSAARHHAIEAVSLTVTHAMLEAGLTGSGGMTHDIGFRGTVGARKHMGPMTIGLYYQTELEHQYQNIHVTSFDGSAPFSSATMSTVQNSPAGDGTATAVVSGVTNHTMKCNASAEVTTSTGVCRQDLVAQQPWNLGLGISMDMGNDMLVMADFTHKAWSDARFFQEFYDDQNVVSFGIQKTMGNIKLRAGYGYADDPLLDTVSVGREISSIGGVNTLGDTYTSPMYNLFMSYFQAMETPVIYKHRIAVGIGVESFLGVPFLSLDAHAAIQLEEDKCFGAGQAGTTDGYNGGSGQVSTSGMSLTTTVDVAECTAQDDTKATVSSFHMGGGLTWTF